MVHRFARVLLTYIALVSSVLVVSPQPVSAGQICGCKKATTGRINRVTAIPPGVAPTCKTPNFELLCWPDEANAGSVTSITAGDGLDATPNPITGVGTIFVSAPMCSATTDKLQWDGSAFQCGTDSASSDVGVGVHNSDVVSVASGPYFVIPFTSEDWDTSEMHDSSAPGDLVAPVAGRYLVTAAAGFGETAAPANPNYNLRELILFKNGGSSSYGQVLVNATTSSPVQETMMSTSAIIDLAAGDKVQVVVTQSSGGDLNLYPSSQAQMQKLN